jgi:RNA polymerase sigma-70 factor (ECF subfamily)
MDADLLLAATYRGDLRAFEALVHAQAGRLRRIAWRITGDETLADDVVQETFLRVLRVPPAGRPSRSAAAWLSRVTVRVALNLLASERARRRREERYAMERSEAMKDATAAGKALPQELDRPVAEALASLSPETRAALWLHVVEGEGVRQVAACLHSSRSTISRRIRAGLEALRASLVKSGVSLAGAAALRSTLLGSEMPPAASLVREILEAGTLAMAAEAASTGKPDALDAALAEPARSLPFPAGIAAAAVVTVGIFAALAWLLFPRSEDDRGGEPAVPIATAPAVLPAGDSPEPKSEERPIEPAPPAPVKEPAVVAGTVRDENGEPIASAGVYLAFHPPAEEDQGQDAMLGRFFRADYYRRSRFLEAESDGEGRFVFERVAETGTATLSAFKEGYSGALAAVKIEAESRSEADLVLAEGRTLTGRVTAADGSPVADAVVSVCQAWSQASHVFRGAGLAPTGADGRFRLGLGAGTAACHLRVNSDSQDQDFFIDVQVEDEGVELTLKEFAQVEGTITWSDGTPASGLTVRATGRLPEPPIPISRMGLRPTAVHNGLVGADGRYVIPGLHPRLGYDIFVIDLSLGERQASMSPLSPRWQHSFRLEPGDVKVWDHAVPKPIVLRGRIHTERSGAPLHEGQVGIRKNGKRLGHVSVWADAEGFFEMRLNTGPGEYRVHAEPPVGFPTSEEASDLIDARFGRTLQLSSHQEVEVDLTIFEPAILPLRVIDHRGEPAENVRAVLHVTFPNGRKLSHDAPRLLDDTGRTSFLLYYPAAEFRYEIGAHPGGPTVETGRHAGEPGVTLPEETVVLPRVCDLTAVLRDASGKPCAECFIYLRVIYEEGPPAELGGRTDKQGTLEVRSRVRAAAFVLELRSQASKILWRSQRLDGTAGNALDLGEVVLAGVDD